MKLTKFTAILLFLCLGGYLSAQQSTAELKNADRLYRQGAYDKAIEYYLDYLVKHTDDKGATIRLARSYEFTGDYLAAKAYYDELIEQDPKPSAMYLLRGNLLKKMMQFDAAIDAYRHYIPVNKERALALMKACRFAKDLTKESKGCDIENLSFNSKQSDSSPSLVKGSLVYLSQRGKLEDAWAAKGDILPAETTAPTLYLVGADEIPEPFILKEAALSLHSAPSITKDAKKMAFSIGEDSGVWEASVKETDNEKMHIVLSAFDEVTNTWVKKDFPYNSKDYSNGFPHLTDAGNTLFYASNMPGGYGKFDIYVSYFKNGTWTKPVNLGEDVNTQGNEISPFLQGDKLYFASDWHYGLGGYDVFRIHHENDKWTGLENMGACINSPNDDYALVIDDSKDKAYFTSNRIGGKGHEDIYAVNSLHQLATKRVLTPKSVELLPEAVAPLEMDLKEEFEDISRVPVSLNTEVEDEAKAEIEEDVLLVRDPSLDGLILDQDNGRKVYFVQIAALSKRKSLDRFKHFRRYGNVYQVHAGNMIKIRIGFFSTMEEAKKVADRLKKKGIREAFIVGDDLQTAQLEIIATARDKSVSASDIDREDMPYTHNSPYKIRVVSYHFPNRINTAELADLGRIEHWTKEDWKIIILSGYKDLDEARQVLKRIHQRGFKDAYIVKETFGKLQRVRYAH